MKNIKVSISDNFYKDKHFINTFSMDCKSLSLWSGLHLPALPSLPAGLPLSKTEQVAHPWELAF